MSLLNPLGLLGLLSIPVLLLIHLFRSTRREHGVPALLLWDMPDRPESRSLSRRLPLSWSLLLQLLLAVILSLIIAEPVFLRDGSAGSELWILVDTSASMGVSPDGGTTPIEAARERSDQLIVDARGAALRVFAVDTQIRQIGDGGQSAAELRAELRGLQHTSAALDPALLSAARADTADAALVFFTDGATDLPEVLVQDPGFRVELVPEPARTNPGPTVRTRDRSNQGIVALSRRDNPLRPGLSELLVSVVNDADVPVERDLQVRRPDGVVGVRTLQIPAQGEVSVVLDAADASASRVRLAGTDLLEADDSAVIPPALRSGWALAATGPVPAALRAIARSAGASEITPDLSLSQAATADLTLVSGVTQALPPGRYLLLGIPPQGIPVEFAGVAPGGPVRWGDVGPELSRQSPRAFASAAAPVLQPGPGVESLVESPDGTLVYLGSAPGLRFAGFALNYFAEATALDPVFPLLLSRMLTDLGLTAGFADRLVRPGEVVELAVDPASESSVSRDGEVLQAWEAGQSVVRFRVPSDSLIPVTLQSGELNLTLYPALLSRRESNLRPRVASVVPGAAGADPRTGTTETAMPADAGSAEPRSLLAGSGPADVFDLRGILLLLVLMLGGVEVLVRIRSA